MKKIFVAFMVIALLLAACGGNGEDAASVNDTAQAASANSDAASGDAADPGERGDVPDFSKMELPLMSQLMLGTFMLEDTEYAVDAEQAAALLPLWKLLNNLSSSETSADQEINAVVEQIEANMTTEQLQAIAEMELNNETSMTLMTELGLDMLQREDSDFEMPTGGGDMGGGPGGDMGGAPAGGGDMGGAPAGDMGGGNMGGGDMAGGDADVSQEDMEAMQATREAGGGGMGGGGNRMNTMFIEPLIELLEGKIS